ncbi:unnamed protein product [Cunninghamella echinulata]
MIKGIIKDWTTFKIEFEKLFINGNLSDAWWKELENTEQGTMMINELQSALKKLFYRLKISDDPTKRYLLKALNKNMAYLTERQRLKIYADTLKCAKEEELLQFKSKANDNNHVGDTSIISSLDTLNDQFQKLRVHTVNNAEDPRPVNVQYNDRDNHNINNNPQYNSRSYSQNNNYRYRYNNQLINNSYNPYGIRQSADQTANLNNPKAYALGI